MFTPSFLFVYERPMKAARSFDVSITATTRPYVVPAYACLTLGFATTIIYFFRFATYYRLASADTEIFSPIPIIHIAFSIAPFQVVRAVVACVFVFVIYFKKITGI
jgi:hypothetical protein